MYREAPPKPVDRNEGRRRLIRIYDEMALLRAECGDLDGARRCCEKIVALESGGDGS